MDEKLFAGLLKRPAVFCLLFLLVAMACTPFITPKFDHTLEGWIDRNSVEYQNYQHLINTFGDDQSVFAVFQRKDLTAEKIPLYLQQLDLIQDMPGVSGIYDPLQRFLGVSELDGINETLVADLKNAISRHPTDFRSTLVSRDTETLGLLVLFDRNHTEQHPAALHVIEQAFKTLEIPCFFGGTVYFADTLNRTLTLDLTVVISLLVVIALTVLLYYFRNLRLVMCVFSGILLTLVFTLAFAGWLGVTISLLSLIIFPLVFCVSVTTAIHLFSRRSEGHWQPLDAYHKIRKPAFMAMLTTAAGCASFAFAPQPVVAKMGMILPLAVMISFFNTLFFVPAAFRLIGKNTHLPAFRLARAQRSSKVKRVITGLLLVSAVTAMSQLGKITTNPDAYYFFKQDSEFVRAYQLIENRLTGLLAFEMILRSDNQQPLTQGQHAQNIQQLIKQLRALPGLTHAVSVFDLLTHLPIEALPDDLRGSLLSNDGSEARLTLRFKNSEHFHYATTVKQIRAIWSQTQHPGLAMSLTGLVPLILEAQDALLKVQSKVFLIGLGILTCLIAIMFRSFKIMLGAIAANFIPLLLTAGVMVLLEIAINSINLFVAGIMLGVIVDDTIHLLYAYRESGRMEDALQEVHAALWITTVTVILAFSTLMFSRFVPVIQFGLLSAVAVFSAYLCDVYLLPYLITDGIRKHEQTTG